MTRTTMSRKQFLEILLKKDKEKDWRAYFRDVDFMEDITNIPLEDLKHVHCIEFTNCVFEGRFYIQSRKRGSLVFQFEDCIAKSIFSVHGKIKDSPIQIAFQKGFGSPFPSNRFGHVRISGFVGELVVDSLAVDWMEIITKTADTHFNFKALSVSEKMTVYCPQENRVEIAGWPAELLPVANAFFPGKRIGTVYF